jgi:transposase InsO family protein
MMTDLIAAIICFCLWLRFHKPDQQQRRRGRRTDAPTVHGRPRCVRRARKPQRAIDETVRLKALHPDEGCRKIADRFNRSFAARGITVSKSWVAGIFKRYEYEIRVCRNHINHRPGQPTAKGRVVGIDLTGKMDQSGHVHMILGAVDHGTRANLVLKALKTKSSIAILRVLLDVFEQYGLPKILRTDNERVFTSRLFRFGLAFLGIRHQTTDLHSPWMNGRIERFFLTLKQKLDHWAIPDFEVLEQSLVEFRFWYNHARPHQHLYGLTPAEAWSGTDIYRRRSNRKHEFEAWQGLLRGDYLPP